jgi:riboflavin transporter FmnP
MSLFYIKRKSVLIAGTALLGAIAAILDWTFKLANLKIPFPLMPVLRFDLLGIPMILALFLFGLASGVTTCAVGALSIAFRGPPNAFLKFVAELSTIIGVYIVLRIKGLGSLHSGKVKLLATGSGITVRVLVMAMTNLLLLPLFFSARYTFESVLFLSPAIAVFNVLQGVISAFGGFFVYEAVIRRLPALKPA